MPPAFYGVPFARVSGDIGRFREVCRPEPWTDELVTALRGHHGNIIPSSRADPKHVLPRRACTQ